MGARRLVWRASYELLAGWAREPAWAFMNYGYAPPGPPRLALEPGDEADRLCVQLYEHVVAGDVRGRDVLEVGSGRGGGASYLARYRHPRTVVGLDLSARAVALSRRDRAAPGLTFVHGDALALPFPDASFDAVVNVESSHCYDDVPAFLAEVRRVLRPGGDFFWADLRPARQVQRVRGELAGCGLRVHREEDVTAEVLRALERDSARKLQLIDAWVPRPLHPAFRPFAGIEGTRNHAGLRSGAQRYLSAWLVREPAPAPWGPGPRAPGPPAAPGAPRCR
ncbi:class I SAM-dependent methyltransferase [Kineococcus indalonis]|uniref:class I SAM-dependent methyltransferase n=1 Tax=Kineococcus indalonis TaxID=2696566 RepID=UPI001412AAE4|nr:class I SAM-dependent methyltransferase [Kineococcus indalonis]NAZ85471.1 methyltransferase domain-containing protein [Kineococcus indalonis]